MENTVMAPPHPLSPKQEERIRAALDKVDIHQSKFRGMTYEQGVEEALMWVLGEISDEEFTYASAPD
jgi:hypothetical protein